MVRSVAVWPPLAWLSLLALVGAFLAARIFRTATTQMLLAFSYLAPGLLALWLGSFGSWDLAPWFAGLVGVMVGTSDPTRWTLPGVWRVPLASWSLVVALSWPVVWWRELDFAPELVRSTAGLANNGVGVPPVTANLWLLSVVLTHGVGILWFDWLCGKFQRARVSQFQKVIILPLAVGWMMSMSVGIYQSLVDPGFINAGHWAVLRRSSGMLMDANPFGMLAALWGAIGICMVLASHGRKDEEKAGSRTDATVWLVGLVLAASWYGIWVSGSRSALIAGLLVLLVLLRCAARESRIFGRRGRLSTGLVSGCLVVVSLVAMNSAMVGPWQRLLPMLPSLSWVSVGELIVELWNRNGYGAAATQMFLENPLVGVGVGAFNVISPDVAALLGYGRVVPDNAQNWFRHQLVEFGLLGSVGWLVWVWMFLRLLADRRLIAAGSSARLVRGALVALGLASLVGMPTQNPALALTFWTLAFWYALLVGHIPQSFSPRVSRRLWIGVWVVALTHAGGLAYLSGSELRVPFRAQRAGWDYGYGFYDEETDRANNGFRWAAGRAAAVVPVSGALIELSAWVHHPDAGRHPVELKIWIDGKLALYSLRENSEPVSLMVRRQARQNSVVIETWVSRTWRPIDYGEEDTRELGPGVRWTFYDP